MGLIFSTGVLLELTPKIRQKVKSLQKDEMRNLRKEYLHAQEEVKRIQSIPLVIGQFLEAIDQFTAIVGSTTGSNYYVRILSTIDRELLKPSSSVALHKEWFSHFFDNFWNIENSNRTYRVKMKLRFSATFHLFTLSTNLRYF